MSVQMMGAVMDCGPQDRTQYCVMIALANYADDIGFCFPSIELVGEKARCDYRTARRVLAELEALGWIYVARKVMNGKGNAYFLNVGRIGVRVSHDARRSREFTRLVKLYGDMMTPIFAPEKSEDTTRFSEDNPQPTQGTLEPTQGTNDPGSEGIACPPNRYNRQSQNRQETIKGLKPPPTPSGGEEPAQPSLSSEAEAPGTANRGPSAHYVHTWENFRGALKREIGTAQHANFSELRPGLGDWDACFRDWWFAGIHREGSKWIFLTKAGDQPTTSAGVAKYLSRLVRTLRLFIPIPASAIVEFNVQQQRTETTTTSAA